MRIKSLSIATTADAGDQVTIYLEHNNHEYHITSPACRSCGEDFLLNNIRTAMNKLLRQIN